MTMSLHAVADDKFSIEAAVARLPKTAFRLMIAAGIDVPKSRLPVGALDLQLAGSKLTAEQRLELKVSLERAGLIQ
jgi:hypothetical protein